MIASQVGEGLNGFLGTSKRAITCLLAMPLKRLFEARPGSLHGQQGADELITSVVGEIRPSDGGDPWRGRQAASWRCTSSAS
jgi:hypothetical protein